MTTSRRGFMRALVALPLLPITAIGKSEGLYIQAENLRTVEFTRLPFFPLANETSGKAITVHLSDWAKS